MACLIDDFFELVAQLDDVVRTDRSRYWRFEVARRTFGYLWEPTRTVGLKQTIAEQLALVAERPLTIIRRLDPNLDDASIMGTNAMFRIGKRAGVILTALGYQITEATDLSLMELDEAAF